MFKEDQKKIAGEHVVFVRDDIPPVILAFRLSNLNTQRPRMPLALLLELLLFLHVDQHEMKIENLWLLDRFEVRLKWSKRGAELYDEECIDITEVESQLITYEVLEDLVLLQRMVYFTL